MGDVFVAQFHPGARSDMGSSNLCPDLLLGPLERPHLGLLSMLHQYHRVGHRVLCLYCGQRDLPSHTLACNAE